MVLPLYTLTLFLSAFVLFLVQPMISKMILPRLGGAPQVWNTCMVFFQTVLLAGYFYTHYSSTRLSLRKQIIIHAVLLFVPLVILLPNGPFNIAGFIPPPGANPIPATLMLLLAVVGIPFFVVSTSAPLLQRWFAYSGHPSSKDPYFLYGASNLGSMLALILYPLLVEWLFLLRDQAWLWTGLYVALIAAVIICAAAIWKNAPAVKFAGDVPDEAVPPSEGIAIAPPTEGPRSSSTSVTASPAATRSAGIRKGPAPRAEMGDNDAIDVAHTRGTGDEVDWMRRLRWIGLAAVPSSLFLGVTTHITTDLSPIPLFWVIPLALYLLSFILVFSRWPVVWVEEPHRIMLYAQPIFIAIMLFIEYLAPTTNNMSMWVPIFFDVVAFFLTALVCHGELAKDRPGTKHLTEFYLMMSIGGMLGGVFNGLIAPVMFPSVWEYGIAVVLACFLRPKTRQGGWSDDFMATFLEDQGQAPAAKPAPKQGGKGGKHSIQRPTPRSARVGASEGLASLMDIALPIALFLLVILLVAMNTALSSLAGNFVAARQDSDSQSFFVYFLTYGVPLAIACFYMGRPVRFGLAICGISLAHTFAMSGGENTLLSDRSYFGVISVKKAYVSRNVNNVEERLPYTSLIHGHIDHGMNFLPPSDPKDLGNPDKDFSRMATTYYHRYGPVGIVMEKYCWFHEPENTYWSDTRIPASLVGNSIANVGSCNLPVTELVTLWSEIPYATIGLGTGTMASYGRPYQAVDYYEIDNHIRRLNLPIEEDETYFTRESLENIDKTQRFRIDDTYFKYLQGAIKRGAEVNVRMGDARLRMAREYKNLHDYPDEGGGPNNFYHMMVVDAFSSDAIPAHLLTKEAFQMYFTKLTEEGILCVHTSNRFVELPKVVAAVTADMGYSCLVGHDQDDNRTKGHYTSEWVMVARKAAYLSDLERLKPADYNAHIAAKGARADPYWTQPVGQSRYMWTDDYSNLAAVIRW